MTQINKCPGKLGHAIYLDTDETPTVIQSADDPWRPARADMCWHVIDERTGQMVDAYQPPKPRHVLRLVSASPVTGGGPQCPAYLKRSDAELLAIKQVDT